jgi:ATP adenylyltransferase
MKYIEGHNKEEGCIFCKALEMADGPENLIVLRGKFAFVMLNKYPYTSGHLMVVPFEHKSTLEELDAQTRAEMMELISQFLVVLPKVYQPQAFNLGANIGEAAGAGVPSHVHLHLVPRWAGDTNFMSVLGGIRILPEALGETYVRVRKAWDESK